jgi:hypothetical protein
MKLYSKKELISEIQEISKKGWHKSVKETIDKRNDAAVGNTLEILLGIKENNLPIQNANDWELKGQRSQTSSLITLKHVEPSPRAVGIVSNVLLPLWGWKHKEAGKKYPENEMSFRSTTSSSNFTNRGFRVVVDRNEKKLKFIFDQTKVDTNDQQISEWLDSVTKRTDVTKGITPEPYWGFDDLEREIGAKISHCFYVIADVEKREGHEYFKFNHLFILSDYTFANFLKSLEDGHIYIDFDARTGHNHGTKFRIKQNNWSALYNSVIQAF